MRICVIKKYTEQLEKSLKKYLNQKKRYSKAKFPAHKKIEDFDFSFLGGANKKERRKILGAFPAKDKNLMVRNVQFGSLMNLSWNRLQSEMLNIYKLKELLPIPQVT